MTSVSPNINTKVRDEFILTEVGGFDEFDKAVLMDITDQTDKETMAEVSAAIQGIVLSSTKPPLNYNADRYFIKRLLDFAKKHRDVLTDKKYKMLLQCADVHMPIAAKNVAEEVDRDVAEQVNTGQLPGPPVPPDQPAAPQINNVPPDQLNI